MKVHIYSVKAKSHTGNICVKDIKRPKPQDTQQECCWKIQQRALGPGESAAGFMHLSMKIHPTSCHILPLKFAATLLNGSGKGAVGA